MDFKREVSREEIKYLEEKYRINIENNASDQDSKFAYAWGLVCSKYKEDNRHGITLLQEISSADSARERECAYYSSIGYYKMGRYREAKSLIQNLLKTEPSNMQFLSLESEISSAITNDGIIGLALVGGVAALAAGVVIGLSRNRS